MWWTWCISGLILLTLEVIQPMGFFLFFLGLGAIATGIVVELVGTGVEDWLPWASFAGFSLFFMVVFRSKAVKLLRKRGPERLPELVGEFAVVIEKSIAPKGTGNVELRGAQWTARNNGIADLHPGTRVKVVRVDGLTVEVMPD